MVSAQIAFGVLAGLYTRVRSWHLGLLLVGLACTISGSGFAIVGIGLVVTLLHPTRALLKHYVLMAGGVAIAMSNTSFGTVLLQRVNEFRDPDSSASLRAIEPYGYLWRPWISQESNVLFGRGPGSAQEFTDQTNVVGLLVPTPAKIFFEYGLVDGGIIAALLLVCYFNGPSRAFSISLLLTLWFLQPGTTTMLVVAPLLIFCTLWSPRIETVLELQPIPTRTRRRPALRRRGLRDRPA